MAHEAVPSPLPPPALDAACRARLRIALEQAATEWGDLGLSAERLAERVHALAVLQHARLSLPLDGPSLRTYVERAALADLCLASSCEDGVERAWTVLHERYGRRLEGFAVKRGLCGPEAEALVQDVFGDLASPPPNAPTRTLLGTFDGSGSLFGWLSVVVLRRLAGQARRRRPEALDALEPAERDAAAPRGREAPPAPPEVVQTEESARAFPAAFAAAFDALTAQQRLALVLKHRDSRSQREIATLLGVGEARVSRVVSAALERLVAALATFRSDGAAPGPVDDDATRAAWAHAVARHLAHHDVASLAASRIPPPGRTGASAATPTGSPAREGG